MAAIAHHFLPDGRRIAHRFHDGAGSVQVFLPGYMSDMAGGKACAVMDHAIARGRACLLLDYSGCGMSDGRFAEGTLTRWREEVLALLAAVVPGRDLVLIGSSMGGWLMLLTALAMPGRVCGLIGLAAAPDFTEWGYDAAQQALLAAGEIVYEANAYGPEPTPTHPAFWVDGQGNRLLGGEITLDCPVHLLHGQADPDVPWNVALKLAATLRSSAVQVTLIKDGDHRLSRPDDIALLLRTLDALAAPLS